MPVGGWIGGWVGRLHLHSEACFVATLKPPLPGSPCKVRQVRRKPAMGSFWSVSAHLAHFARAGGRGGFKVVAKQRRWMHSEACFVATLKPPLPGSPCKVRQVRRKPAMGSFWSLLERFGALGRSGASRCTWRTLHGLPGRGGFKVATEQLHWCRFEAFRRTLRTSHGLPGRGGFNVAATQRRRRWSGVFRRTCRTLHELGGGRF